MRHRILVIAAAAALVATPALAQFGTPQNPDLPQGAVDIGQAINALVIPVLSAAATAIVSVGMPWLFYIARTKLNLSIDADHRAALTQFVQRQAASLIADGKVSLQDKTIHVDNVAMAHAANEALTMIPDALKHFGITPETVADDVGARIKDAIPQVPAAASTVAAGIAAPAAA